MIYCFSYFTTVLDGSQFKGFVPLSSNPAHNGRGGRVSGIRLDAAQVPCAEILEDSCESLESTPLRSNSASRT